MLDEIRYFLALASVLTLPPAILFWLLVHPFVGFWRRVGPTPTYATLAVGFVGFGVAVWPLREAVLAVRYPTSPIMTMLGALFYGAAIWVELRCRRHLKLAILVGLPELRRSAEGRLLTEGIYGRIRHPRYVAVVLGTLGVAFFCNYLAVWGLALMVPVGLLAVVHFEERELRARFGADFVDYTRRVPRFLPRRA